LLARFGGKNTPKIKAAMAKHYKPYSKMIEAGTLESKKEEELQIKVFVESCLRDWKGIEIGGVAKECTAENAMELFKALPNLFEQLVSHCSNAANYKENYTEALGNS
jgi:hypothetical protein